MGDSSSAGGNDVIAFTAEVLSPHLKKRHYHHNRPSSLQQIVHDTQPHLAGRYSAEKPEPEISICGSATSGCITRLEDCWKLNILKRHLWMGYGVTPDEYCEEKGLPAILPNGRAQLC